MALASLAGVGGALCRRLAGAFAGPRALFETDPDELQRAGVSEPLARAIAEFSGWSEVDREIERAAELGVTLLCPSDDGYPLGLRYIHDPPPVLYVRGTLEREDVEAIAVVGSRRASAYGLTVAERIAADLAAARVTVVSGLALGVDAAAHRGALSGRGRTIAVLGSGVDRIYPDRHRALAGEVAASGAVVSELGFGAPPVPENFPRRNRLVSGLSLGVVVVEAGERSGSLITARLALEQGREVMAIPGESGLARTRGTHALLRRGARLVENAADVVEDVMPWRDRRRTIAEPALPPAADTPAARILEAFESSIEHVDRLIERSGLSVASALEALLDLELAGRVIQHPGKLFARSPGRLRTGGGG